MKEKYESQEVERKLKEDIEKYFHFVLKETNNRLSKENKKFVYLITLIENLKERYENDNKRYIDQYWIQILFLCFNWGFLELISSQQNTAKLKKK